MMNTSPPKGSGIFQRRAILLGAGAAAGTLWWGWPRVAPYFVGAFDFEPLADPSGFRRIAGGRTSGLASPFIGLNPGADTSASLQQQLRGDLCTALFGAPPDAGVVPVASFSDYNCPYCRVLTERLVALERRADGAVQMAWHEWPLLGPSSVLSARAALAADMQGLYGAFHKRLMRARFIPTERYLAALAEDIGADPARLRDDMNGAAVTARLQRTDAVARIFGFVGTPVLVVGRTIVVGAISQRVLGALITQERRDGPLPTCRL